MVGATVDIQREQRISRSVACLLGGAVGDSLGSPVEFWTMERIRREFGPDGITAIAPSWGQPAAITDDTQMTLFTAEGLLRAQVRMANKGICHYPSMVAHAYQRWYRTQGEDSPIAFGDDAGLVTLRQLHARRSPGNTCLSALANMESLGDRAHNNSKGCGGVMRAAPAGLFAFRVDPSRVFNLGCDTARITHGHPGGYLPAGCLAVIVAELIKGESLHAAIDAATQQLQQHAGHEETSSLIEKARALASSGTVGPESLARNLGGGWTGDEALAIALACALVAVNFDEGVRLAVNHDGDSDSTGAIAGNILGARSGLVAIDFERWLAKLELRDVIAGIGRDLAIYPEWDLTDSEVWRSYPGS